MMSADHAMGTRLPYASALYGARPGNNDPRRWELKNNTPLSRGKTREELARAMYNPIFSRYLRDG